MLQLVVTIVSVNFTFKIVKLILNAMPRCGGEPLNVITIFGVELDIRFPRSIVEHEKEGNLTSKNIFILKNIDPKFPTFKCLPK